MKNWKQKHLGDLAELRGRIGWRGLTAKEYTKEGPLFLSVHSLNYGDYVDFRDAFHISEERYLESPEIMLQAGDVLICKDGAGIGKVGILGALPDRATINSSLLLIRSKRDILPKFLYHCLTSPYFQEIVQSRLNGATTPHLYQRDITEFPVVLPPLPEQQRIVEMLDEAFAGIAAAEANTEKNLQNARALFESHVHSVFTQRSEGWIETTIEKISTNLDCKRVPITKSVRTKGKYPYYGASGIVDYVDDFIFDGDMLLVSEDGANLLSRSSPIAFSVSGKCWVNNHAHILKFKNMATQRFVEFYLENTKLDDYITGAAQPKLNQKALNSIPIPIPESTAAQEEIVASIDSLQTETRRLTAIYERKIAALEELKKSLLHQAFTGKLTANWRPSNIISFPAVLPGIATLDLHAGLVAITHQYHVEQGTERYCGHVKMEKSPHMYEAHYGLELERHPYKDAAGPNDMSRLLEMEIHARKNRYFDIEGSEETGYKLKPLSGYDGLIERTRKALGDKLSAIEEFLRLTHQMNRRSIELLATLYAAWNNLLLDQEEVTDERIVHESRENWHEDKLKIERQEFFDMLVFMRKNGLVPTGRGKRVAAKT